MGCFSYLVTQEDRLWHLSKFETWGNQMRGRWANCMMFDSVRAEILCNTAACWLWKLLHTFHSHPFFLPPRQRAVITPYNVCWCQSSNTHTGKCLIVEHKIIQIKIIMSFLITKTFYPTLFFPFLSPLKPKSLIYWLRWNKGFHGNSSKTMNFKAFCLSYKSIPEFMSNKMSQ